jgi:hypothetical protein
MRFACFAPLFLFTSLIAQEGVPAPATAKARIPSSREVIRVGEQVRVLKESTLPWDLPMNSDPTVWMDPGGASSFMTESLQGPIGASVALDNTSASVQDGDDSAKVGLRLYSFTLKPNETIYFRSKGYPMGKIVMTFSLPKKMDEMYSKIKSINRIQFSVQRSRIELKNVLSEPFTCVLRLGGFCGYPYVLEIERS